MPISGLGLGSSIMGRGNPVERLAGLNVNHSNSKTVLLIIGDYFSGAPMMLANLLPEFWDSAGK